MTEQEFIQKMGAAAREDMQISGILASITTAQGILESGYGSSELAVNAMNFFGMKCSLSGNTWESVWDGVSKYTKRTKEQKTTGEIYEITADFRKYPSMEKSVRDHSLYLLGAMNGKKKRYEGLAGEKDYKKAIQIIKNGGYATSLTYVDKICNIIERFNLTEYDKEETIMSNSSMVVYTKISPNKTTPRNHAIDTITIHCMAGNCSIETCGNIFAPTSRQASSNYGIGSDGRVGMYVEEKDRSWCTSNGANDHRAITIEVANDGREDTGWHVSDAAMDSLIKLCADICKRNGIKQLVWSTNKNDRVNHLNGCNMTVHRDYANKSCPGEYLYSKHGYIAAEVNKLLGTEEKGQDEPNTKPQSMPGTPFIVKVLIDDLNYRSEPYMSGKVNGQTGKGAFTIVEVSNGWGKLKSGAGWIYLENPSYVEIIGSTEEKPKEESKYPATPFIVRVLIDDLNYRSEPSMSGKVKGQTGKGSFTITEVSDGWGRLKSGVGWIYIDNADYVQIVR